MNWTVKTLMLESLQSRAEQISFSISSSLSVEEDTLMDSS